MNRTNRGGLMPAAGIPNRLGPSWAEFLAANRLLLVFSLLFLAGVLLGVMVFSMTHSLISGELGLMLETGSASENFQNGITALFSSAFSTVLLLALLFLLGLSACGAPIAALIPLFFGMGLGLTEAYYYSVGVSGLAVVGLLIVPHYLIAGTALVLGSLESIRMSLLFSRQLLPSGAMGGLWADFKLYCVRFIVFLGLAFASGVIDVLLRLAFGRLLLKE